MRENQKAERIRQKEDEIRQALLKALSSASDNQPGLRVLQLITNAIPPKELERRQGDIYYITDAQMLMFLRDYPDTVQAIQAPEEK